MGASRSYRSKSKKEPERDPVSTSSDVRGTKRSDSFDTDADESRSDTRSKVPRRKYKRHPKPDTNAPERPLTAYVRFAKDRRRDYEGRGLTFSDLAKQIGVEWQELDSNLKTTYLAAAGDDWTKYRKALNNYQNTKEHAEYVAYLHEFARKNPGSNVKPPYADLLESPSRDGSHDEPSPKSESESYRASPSEHYQEPYNYPTQFGDASQLSYDFESGPGVFETTNFASQMNGFSNMSPFPQRHFHQQMPAYSNSDALPSQLSTSHVPGRGVSNYSAWTPHHPQLHLNTFAGSVSQIAGPQSSAGPQNKRLSEALSKAFEVHSSTNWSADSSASPATPSLGASDFSASSTDFFLPHMGAQLPPHDSSFGYTPHLHNNGCVDFGPGACDAKSVPSTALIPASGTGSPLLDESWSKFIASDVHTAC